MEILVAVLAIVGILIFVAARVLYVTVLAVGIALAVILLGLAGIGSALAVIVIFAVYLVIECVKYRNSTS